MNHTPDDAHVLLDLAAKIERDCRLGLPVLPELQTLRIALAERAGEPLLDPPVAAAYTRLEAVVGQITRDVESGHVRSISGLVVQVLRVVDAYHGSSSAFAVRPGESAST